MMIYIVSTNEHCFIRDAYNDWVEVGDDHGRTCWRHNTNYSPPRWGINAGKCPPWSGQKTCAIKGNIYCCRKKNYVVENL